MHPSSSSSSITSHWPLSLCHRFGRQALQTLKSAICDINLRSANGTCFIADRHGEALGWLIQTRFHFGNHLSHYVGVAVFINTNSVASFARTSGLVLLVGVGSYIAYRLCLKLLGCQDLASLLRRLCKGNSDRREENATSDRCGRCGMCKREGIGAATTSEQENKSPITCRCRRHRKTRRWKKGSGLQEGRPSSSSGSSTTSDESSTDEKDRSTTSTDLASNCSRNSRARAQRLVKESSDKLDSGLQQRKRWRNSAGKRTNALDDTDAGGACSGTDSENGGNGGSVKGFSNSRSPPPIPRSTKLPFESDTTMTKSVPVPRRYPNTPSIKSTLSVPSSQHFIWDPVCSPGDEPPVSDELLSYFADVPTGELVQRFLDGMLLPNEQNRLTSPGPSEAASECFVADRLIGDGTAENFERLQCDLSELRTDVAEFDMELSTYLQERSECLQSDSRLFYRSVIVDDSDELSGSPGHGAIENEEDRTNGNVPRGKEGETDVAGFVEDSSPSPSSGNGDRNENTPGKIPDTCRTPVKRQRKSQESSTGSSNEECAGMRRTPKRWKRQCDGSGEVKQEEHDRRSSIDEPSSTYQSTSEKSAISVDTGYVSSYHTLWSSGCSGHDELKQTDEKEKRPRILDVPSISFNVDDGQWNLGSAGSDRQLSSLFDSVTSSSSIPTPSSHHRPPSSISLEWDEMLEGRYARTPSSCADDARGSKQKIKKMDLLEFLRLYNNVERLEELPKIYQFGRKLAQRGYQEVLLNGQVQTSMDGLIMASLVGATYYRYRIFKCKSFQVVQEAINVSMKRCSFFTASCTSYFGSVTPENTRACILRCMQKLWELHESVQQDEHRNIRTLPSSCWTILEDHAGTIVDGMKVLMALRSMETYEEILFTRHAPCTFYTDLFRRHSPASYAQHSLFVRHNSSDTPTSSGSNIDDLDIALLADTMGIRIEIFRPESVHPKSVAVYPELGRTANQPRLPLLEPASSGCMFFPLINKL